MKWLFKKSKALFYVLLIVAAVILILFAADIKSGEKVILPILGLKQLNLAWALVIFSAWYFVASIITVRYERVLLRKIDDLLVSECDPYSCIEEHKKILPKSTRDMKIYVLVELCGAYLAAGDTDSAWEYLDEVTSFPQQKSRGASYKFVHYSHMVNYSILTENQEAAEYWLKKMREILDDDNNGMGAETKGIWEKHYTSQMYTLNVANGEFEGAEEVFLADFNTAYTQLSKVAAKCKLGKVYLHFNRPDEAKAALEYVIANGNKTRHVDDAQEMLEQIGQTQ